MRPNINSGAPLTTANFGYGEQVTVPLGGTANQGKQSSNMQLDNDQIG